MRVALVHELLMRRGGAERVTQALAELYPEADIFLILGDAHRAAELFPGRRIIFSFLQKWPAFLRRHFQLLLPFFPAAVESFDLSGYDLVISSASAFGKGVITKPDTLHICYMHTPMRFAWDWYFEYLRDERTAQARGVWGEPTLLRLTAFMARLVLHFLRLWDYEAAKRPDAIIANSRTTQRRIRKYYGRESTVIYPPVELAQNDLPSPTALEALDPQLLQQLREGKFYFIAAALSPYKNIDLAVRAFNNLQLPLVIAGDGKERKHLQKLADHTIYFTGFLADDILAVFYRKCRAFIFSGEDDFGIAPVEAMQYGKPVLALRRGGATETVQDGANGLFFDYPEVELLADGVRRMEERYAAFDPAAIRHSAEAFKKSQFARTIQAYVQAHYRNYFADHSALPEE